MLMSISSTVLFHSSIKMNDSNHPFFKNFLTSSNKLSDFQSLIEIYGLGMAKLVGMEDA